MDEPLPGEKLAGKLEELRLKLQPFISRLDESGVERTAGLLAWKGRSCGYYWKSLDLFLKLDYVELRDMIVELHSLIQEIESGR